MFLFTATEYVLFLPVGLLFIKKELADLHLDPDLHFSTGFHAAS